MNSLRNLCISCSLRLVRVYDFCSYTDKVTFSNRRDREKRRLRREINMIYTAAASLLVLL
jgi:hypothetical protein